MIEADIDRYGGLIRSSYLADYLEVLALRGKRCTFAQLADMVSDRWNLKQQILVTPDEDPEDEAVTFSDGAIACIRERKQILGSSYPFELSNSHIKLIDGYDLHNSSYVALLSITMAHAYKIDAAMNVEQTFEDVVADSLAGLGLAVGNVGALSRANSMNFERTIDALGAALNIKMNANAAVRRRHANDGGVDVVACLDWGDGRSGRWTLLGQATCGSSDTWQSKLAEPKPEMWKRIMSETSSPKCFLAVPHHVEESAYREISENTGHTVVDRPRLVPFVRSLPQGIGNVIQSVLDTPLQTSEV
ncbi:hypothetical protein [Arthrobacter sp. D1-17]